MKYMIQCAYCGKETEATRSDKRFCSDNCGRSYRVHQNAKPKSRICAQCGIVFRLKSRGDNARKYCSRQCAKIAESKQISTWHYENPDSMKTYNQNRAQKDPQVWRRKSKLGREEALELLGGKCLVCGVDNPNWLHIDYIPSSRGLKYRHPRHIAYIKNHLDEFRILCANHHYELTITGKIEGTGITQ